MSLEKLNSPHFIIAAFSSNIWLNKNDKWKSQDVGLDCGDHRWMFHSQLSQSGPQTPGPSSCSPSIYLSLKSLRGCVTKGCHVQTISHTSTDHTEELINETEVWALVCQFIVRNMWRRHYSVFLNHTEIVHLCRCHPRTQNKLSYPTTNNSTLIPSSTLKHSYAPV